MAIMPIITYGNCILRQKAEEVKEITPEIRAIVRNLEDTLGQEDGIGIGLAAPQLGISKRILVIDLKRSKEDRRIALINPKIVYKSDEKSDYEEGCLSVPGVWGNVRRPKKVKVKATLISGKTMIMDADDLFARVLQHEIDHLNGILFIDLLDPEDKDRNRIQINAIAEENRKRGEICL